MSISSSDILETLIGFALIFVLVSIIIFLVTRWYWCWYFKINARLKEQEKTNELLTGILYALAESNQLDIESINRMTGKLNKIDHSLQNGGVTVRETASAIPVKQNSPSGGDEAPLSAGRADHTLPKL